MTACTKRAAANVATTVSNALAVATARAKHLPLGPIARLARAAAGVTQCELARTSGAPRAWIQRWERGEHGPRVDHLLRGPREYRRFIVRELAAADGDVVHAAQADDLTHEQRTAVLARECTDPLRVYLAALADDARLDAAERADVVRELRELILVASSALVAIEGEGRT